MRSEGERHTESRMPKPANIAFAGGNGCKCHQKQGTLINGSRRTIRPIDSLSAELMEGKHNTSTEELRTFMSFPSFSLNSRKLCACSRSMAIIESTDSHVSSCLAIGSSTREFPVLSL